MKLNLAIAAFIFVLTNSAFAQIKGMSTEENQGLFEQDTRQQMADQELMTPDQFPVGNKVDPDHYYIGPNDVLTINISPLFTMPLNVKVTPENSIHIPGYGEFKFKDKTVTDVRDSLKEYFTDINKKIKLSLSLAKARTCLVKIEGNVAFPSTYTLPASYTVSTAILFANQIQRSNEVPYQQMPALLNVQRQQRETEQNYFNSGIPPAESYDSRNITVIHNEGLATNVDIEKAIALESKKFDPYIREGDRIIVPFEKIGYKKISINGGVYKPKIVPFKEGDKASYLLKFGRGFSEDADLDNIYLINPNSNERIKLEVDSNMNLEERDHKLEPGSTIIVGMEPEERVSNQGVVSVQGEVNTPGTFLIHSGETTLTDIIEQSGGFTDAAYLPLANIIRRNKEKENLIDPQQKTFELFQYSDLLMQDTTRFKMDIRYRKSYVATNFYELFEKNEKSFDVALKDGDIINVPSNPGNVFVFGQVKNPGFVDFKPGKRMEYYIGKCGGFTEGADDGRTSIIRGRNKVWIEGDDDVFVYAGDQVYVPSPPAFPPNYEIQKFNTYVYLISGVVGIVNTILIILSRNEK